MRGTIRAMSYQVLIVDDSKLARMAIAKALNTLHPDWTRREAANVDEARAILKESSVDVALIDFNMPGLDGLAFAAELRGQSPGMPVAIISANHQKEIVNQSEDVGAAFIAKPLNEQALGAFLEKAVRRLEAAK
jgi:DNA-binding NtrC family response regulator